MGTKGQRLIRLLQAFKYFKRLQLVFCQRIPIELNDHLLAVQAFHLGSGDAGHRFDFIREIGERPFEFGKFRFVPVEHIGNQRECQVQLFDACFLRLFRETAGCALCLLLDRIDQAIRLYAVFNFQCDDGSRIR